MSRLSSVLPFMNWFQEYTADKLKADFLAGLTVALVIVPQSMAYAQLAGLPPYFGLYAALIPPVVAVILGSSFHLATGPVAIVSLMTSAALVPLAAPGSETYIAYALLLALMTGVFQFLLGVFRLGLLVNFLSHPVVNGFTNAAAIVIATSQLPQLLGVSVDKADHHFMTVYKVLVMATHHVHWPTLGLAFMAVLTMAVLKWINPRLPYVLVGVVLATIVSRAIGFEDNRSVRLDQIKAPELVEQIGSYNQLVAQIDQLMADRVALTRRIRDLASGSRSNGDRVIEANADLAKLLVRIEMLTERSSQLRDRVRDHWFVAVKGPEDQLLFYPADSPPPGEPRVGGHWRLKVDNSAIDKNSLPILGGGRVVGSIPQGLPGLTVPVIDAEIVADLFPMAIIISILGFMEAISIAKRIAQATGQRLDPNQELVGQGLSNIVGSMFHSYPVSGSFSRSAINFQAGAQTGLAMVFSSVVVFVTLMFLTPLLYHLPLSVLAAVIMMAVFNLINVRGFVHAWKAQKYDGIISVVTLFTTLGFAPHLQIGILTGVVLSTALFLYRTMRPNWWLLSRTPDGAYRRVDEWRLQACKHVAVLAFNRSIMFANISRLEEALEQIIGEMEELEHVLIVGYAINELDASGEVALSVLVSRLRGAGYGVSFCGLNDHVLAVMKRTGLYEKIGESHFYASVAQAIQTIHRGSCIRHSGACPLVDPQLGRYEELSGGAPQAN